MFYEILESKAGQLADCIVYENLFFAFQLAQQDDSVQFSLIQKLLRIQFV